MTLLSRVTWLAYVSMLLLPSAAWASRMAVVIGNNYGSSSRAPLRYAEQDARKVHSVLKQIGGFSERNTRLLTGKNPDAVLEAIRGLNGVQAPFARIFGPSPEKLSLMVIYYSGHSENGRLEMGGRYLSFQDLRNEARKLNAATTLFIFDTCESGQILQAKGGTVLPPLSLPDSITTPPTGEIIMTSSSDLEESFESSEIRGSFFTHFLVSAIRGAADFNLDGHVSLSEAYSYAGQETRTVTARLRHSQNPTLDVNLTGSGEVVLSTIGGKSPLLSLPPSESGRFLILDSRSGNPVAEIRKEAGTSQHIALPIGDLMVQKRRDEYSVEQQLSAQPGGLYEFSESSGARVALRGSRLIESRAAPQKGRAVTLREGEIVRLKLVDAVSTGNSQEGDKIRMEAAEDLIVDGRPVILAGAHATGDVVAIRQKRGLVSGELVCRLGYVQATDGQWIPLQSLISRNPSGLKELGEGENVFSPAGSEMETDIASGLTAIFFLPFYPFLKGRDAVMEPGTIFEAYVARDIKIR